VSAVIQDPEDLTRYLIAATTNAFFGAHQGVAVLENVHPETACAGRNCVIHNPSNHHMRLWPLVWRDDKGVMERTCPHGVGHPDPDDAAFLMSVGREHLTIHGCDLCCAGPPDESEATA
jgi:hypothetical protein